MTGTRSPLVDGSNPFLATKHKLGKTHPMPDIADYITTEEAATKLGFNVIHVRAMIRDGKLEGLKAGRSWLVSKKAIEAYLKKTSGMSKHDPRRSQN